MKFSRGKKDEQTTSSDVIADLIEDGADPNDDPEPDPVAQEADGDEDDDADEPSGAKRGLRKKADKVSPLEWRDGWFAVLLPQEIAQRAKARRERGLFTVGGALVLVVLALTQTYQILQTQEADERVSVAQASLDSLQTQLADLSDVTGAEREITAASDLIDLVFADASAPAHVLEAIDELRPFGIDVTQGSINVGQRTPPGPFFLGAEETFGQILINGTSPDISTANEYVRALNASEHFFFVQMDSFGESTNVDGTVDIEFSITADLSRASALHNEDLEDPDELTEDNEEDDQ